MWLSCLPWSDRISCSGRNGYRQKLVAAATGFAVRMGSFIAVGRSSVTVTHSGHWYLGRAAAMYARILIWLFASLFAVISVAASANAETRTLKIYHVHTGERAEITFKRNGVYLPDGLNKINKIMRDWRRNEPTKMDPRVLDAIWEVYQQTGSREFINVVCGYRSPATNSMLRRRSNGVAEKSQHMKGKAVDFYIPGVPLKKLRYLGLQRQAGGVGYYPRSGSPFVHMDVGSVRHWPRMSRSELLAVFPSGKTLHVPSDGKPLPGYDVAMASYKSRVKVGSSLKFGSSSGDKPKSLLAALFGGGADEDEDNSSADEVVIAAAKPGKRAPAAVEIASQETPVKQRQTKEVLVADLPQRTSPAPLAIVRPPADIKEELPVETEALAFAVPVPSRKPRLNPVLAEPSAELALAARMAPEPAAPVQLASAEPQGDAETIRASLGAEAPAEQVVAVADEPFMKGAVPVPGRKPDHNDEFMVASVAVPAPRPVINGVSASGAMASMTDALPVEEVAFAVPANKPDPADQDLRALLAQNQDIDPETVADTGTRTTDKASKPRLGDAKKARKPVAVPVTQDLGKFALSKEPVTTNGNEVVAVNYAQATVWTAPTEVYVAGFSTDAPQDVNTFSGKAVNFLKVAKFKKAK